MDQTKPNMHQNCASLRQDLLHPSFIWRELETKSDKRRQLLGVHVLTDDNKVLQNHPCQMIFS